MSEDKHRQQGHKNVVTGGMIFFQICQQLETVCGVVLVCASLMDKGMMFLASCLLNVPAACRVNLKDGSA